MTIDKLHTLFLRSTGISTDTRKIHNGNIFFALKGDNFNANDFTQQALEKGAQWAVVDEPQKLQKEKCILVDNALQTLQELATYHRNYLDIPIIALTGSNGKTTTKELIHTALSRKYRTTATSGNLNNHIGVPITLLSMTPDTEIGIVEMGANHRKEIAFLCTIAQPDYGYITNFGKAHLEGFGGVEGVIKGKSELYDYLKEHNKTLFINMDDPIQKRSATYSKVFSFAQDNQADIHIEYMQQDSFAAIQVNNLQIRSQLTGSYNGKNMAAAYAIASFFEVDPLMIKEALENYVPGNNRSQIIKKANTTIILDAYNANPTSMEAAIENLENMPGKPKTVILGDMFEMGAAAEKEHQDIVDKLVNSRIENVYLVGEAFYNTSTSPDIKKFRSYEDFTAGFHPSEIREGIVLIKGSRGMALERTLELL